MSEKEVTKEKKVAAPAPTPAAAASASTTESEKKVKKTPVTKSAKANLCFPVGRIHRMLKDKVSVKRVSVLAAVYLAAILEYLTSEVLELTTSTLTKDYHVRRITPRHLLLSIKTDEELDNLIRTSTTIAGGGVLPHIHKVLYKKGEEKGAPVKH
ncbi:hypothetical protein CYY_001074 [Polysphondylium violaceum]|uniref:Histone H2A n=1 Tax=Polysphondylium violaceum TaxID=133409 RepID=A0A8J4UWJ8_9MYCE|nr:hypothetical protein CYY_001074 [Polysphondylium violaceum]